MADSLSIVCVTTPGVSDLLSQTTNIELATTGKVKQERGRTGGKKTSRQEEILSARY